MDRLVEAPVQVGQLARGGVDVDVLSGTSVPSPGCAVRSRRVASSVLVGQCSAHDAATRPRAHPSTPTGSPTPGRLVAVEVVDGDPLHQRRWSPSAPATGAAEGLVVVAEHQTAGRGRLDRTWETPARAALTFSVLLRPDRARPATGRGCRCSPGTPSRGARCADRPELAAQVAQRRAGRRPQGRRHPGRAGRDAGRPGRGGRRRAQRRHDRRGAAGRDGDLARRWPAWPSPDRTGAAARHVLGRPARGVRRVAGAAAPTALRAAYAAACATIGRDGAGRPARRATLTGRAPVDRRRALDRAAARRAAWSAAADGTRRAAPADVRARARGAGRRRSVT